VDSLMELFEEFDGRIAKEAGVSSRWSMTVVCSSLRKKIILIIDLHFAKSTEQDVYEQ
jgi:hypothetical protein